MDRRTKRRRHARAMRVSGWDRPATTTPIADIRAIAVAAHAHSYDLDALVAAKHEEVDTHLSRGQTVQLVAHGKPLGEPILPLNAIGYKAEIATGVLSDSVPEVEWADTVTPNPDGTYTHTMRPRSDDGQ